MSATPEIIVHRDAEVLAQAVAARLITRVVDVQALRGAAHVVLTGGTVGVKTLVAVADSPARAAVDWSRVQLWWGDERFLPSGHPERNETQAREALLDTLVSEGLLPPENIHPMPAADTVGITPEESAEQYAATLADFARNGADVPSFDVLLLGMGPDGHIASLFPGHPALYEEQRTVVGVHGSPKPPPLRVSLTLPAIRSAAEIWVVAAGAEKAKVTHLALSGAGPVQIPAAGARGRGRSLWLLDRASASELPKELAPYSLS
ncbi:MAG: 6-phosphogluconolactonase [Catenulispora sp. 13_1_20CM_3_70_7]|nr:6-phosphogluconolactonase [Catenulisporales bacterium]OLE22275.1 MAG: 6-phosphogluconolactonase [Catenulispora sp. 13_1_20CM_3_70_7]